MSDCNTYQKIRLSTSDTEFINRIITILDGLDKEDVEVDDFDYEEGVVLTDFLDALGLDCDKGVFYEGEDSWVTGWETFPGEGKLEGKTVLELTIMIVHYIDEYDVYEAEGCILEYADLPKDAYVAYEILSSNFRRNIFQLFRCDTLDLFFRTKYLFNSGSGKIWGIEKKVESDEEMCSLLAKALDHPVDANNLEEAIEEINGLDNADAFCSPVHEAEEEFVYKPENVFGTLSSGKTEES